MKKILAIILMFSLMFTFTACESEPTGKENKEEKTNSATKESKKETDKKEDKAKISFEETVVVDNDDCMITLTEIDPDNMWGFTFKAQLENKSTEKTYMFSVESAAINGVQCDPLFASEVAPGKKSNEDISFDKDSFADDIGNFSDIEITFRVYDSDNWSADAVANETVHIYPYGENAATKFVRESKSSDTVLVDNDDFSVIITGYEEDDIWGYCANFYIANKTDKNLMFSVDDASINGFMSDPVFATTIIPGKSEYSTMSWSDDDLSENDITEIEKIEFKLRVYDYDNWSAGDLLNERFTLNP